MFFVFVSLKAVFLLFMFQDNLSLLSTLSPLPLQKEEESLSITLFNTLLKPIKSTHTHLLLTPVR